MLFKHFVLSVSFVISLAACGAAQSPGVREVTVDTRNLVPITAQLRYSTMIVLPEEEQILDVDCGDKDFWVVQASNNIVRVKPAKEAAHTNLNLRATSGTIYSFLLREATGTKREPDVKVYIVNEGLPALAGVPGFHTQAEMQRVEAELTAARAALETAERRATETIAAQRVQYPAQLQFVYHWKDHKTLRIRAMWHDGQSTYLKVDARELPALYDTRDGEPALTNYQVVGNTYIVPKLLDRGSLILGKVRVTFAQGR